MRSGRIMLLLPDLSESEYQPLHGGLEVVGRQVRVNLRRLDAGVAEQFLDRVKVGAAHHQMAGEAVTQCVDRRALDPSASDELEEIMGQDIGIEGLALPVHEDKGTVSSRMVRQNFREPGSHWDMARFVVLGLPIALCLD